MRVVTWHFVGGNAIMMALLASLERLIEKGEHVVEKHFIVVVGCR